MWDLVAEDLLVHGYQNQPFQLRLRHKQSVEWITMQLRKRAGPLSMLNGNGQSRETVTHNGLHQHLTAISHTVTALTRTSLLGEAIAE